MPKNIVVFSDGTGQEGGIGDNTNVYKLFNMVLDRSPDQIVFYDRGIGTGWRKFTTKVAGAGFSKNVLNCYDFIFNNYQAGDQIFLFGFSRGAATVPSLSSFIHHFGILPQSRRELTERAFKIYKTNNPEKRRKKAAEFISRHHTMWVRIKFIGVWDTVAALGVPFKWADNLLDKVPILKHKFHDLSLSASIENAYHALALDDEREVFHPELWDTNTLGYQTLEQVWFPGMHTDVGGGYAEQQLSDLALEWMISRALKHDLKIYPDHHVNIDSNPNGKMHNSRKEWRKKILYRRKGRSWPVDTHGNPVIHESVLRQTLNRENEVTPAYKPWILDGSYSYDVSP